MQHGRGATGIFIAAWFVACSDGARKLEPSSVPEPAPSSSSAPEPEPTSSPAPEPPLKPPTPKSRVVLLTVQAAFAGTSRAFAERFPRLLDAELLERVERVDLLVADERNDPPDEAALARWRVRAGDGVEVRAVSQDELGLEPTTERGSERVALPLVRILDAERGETLCTLEGAWPLDVRDALVRELARLDGAPEPEPAEHPTSDARFTEDTWALIEDMRLEKLELAPDPTNAFADDVRARELGEKLFFDPGFSSNGGVSCGSCHQRDRAFGNNNGRPPQGVGSARRKAPSVVFSRFAPVQFWDGRIDTLWGQATMPVEDAREMDFTRVGVLRRLAEQYRSEVESIFGPLPSEAEIAKLPNQAKPGMPEWDALNAEEQREATRALVIYGKAVAAFERSLKTAPLPLDAYANGDLEALTDAQKDGLLAFVKSGCPQCHYGPRLTDDSFHVLRAPTGFPDLSPDPGLAAVFSEANAHPMRAAGPHSDSRASADRLPVPTLIHPGQRGAFRTPPLRGAGSNAPYGHGGGDSTLRKIVELHRVGGLPEGSRYTTGSADRWLVPFSEEERDRIVTFLEALPLVLSE